MSVSKGQHNPKSIPPRDGGATAPADTAGTEPGPADTSTSPARPTRARSRTSPARPTRARSRTSPAPAGSESPPAPEPVSFAEAVDQFGPNSQPAKIKKSSPPADDDSPRAGRPPDWKIPGEIIASEMFPHKFARAHARDEPNKRAILCRTTVKDSSQANGYRYVWSPIWLGDMGIDGRVQSFGITPSRRLKRPEWHEYVKAWCVTNMPNAKPNRALLASADLVQFKSKAQWTEQLGVTLATEKVARISEFLRMLALERCQRKLMIQGQGPVYLDDGSPDGGSELLDGSLVFATRSGVFNTDGQYCDIETDLERIPDRCNYYDLTPVDEITAREVRDGLELFRVALKECTDKYAAIPAAFIGQLCSGWLASIQPKFWSAVHLTGEKGSGKTYYCVRWDAIQGRNPAKLRDGLEVIKPAVNLGDTTGTDKGPKYTLQQCGGYSVTADDVLKKGATEFEIRKGTQRISDIIRSFLEGGGSQARVDRERNLINAAEAPALPASIKVPSEIPVESDSTLDRMIYLPHITDSWDKGTAFDLAKSSLLSAPESRELMHRAYSALVYWGFQYIDFWIQKAYERAVKETDTWNVPARTAERYSAVLAGLYILETFANSTERLNRHGQKGQKLELDNSVDLSAEIAQAAGALKLAAQTQSGASVPVALQWARGLRRAMGSRVMFPGPSRASSDDVHGEAYSDVGMLVNTGENADGTPETTYVMPWDDATLSDFGMAPNSKENTSSRATVYGYTMPPYSLSKSGGRPPSEPLLDRWHVALTREKFEDLCGLLSRTDEYGYDPNTVMRSLIEMGMGAKTRVCFRPGKQRAAWVFNTELLRAVDDEGEG